jgi:protein-arginine kinase activator protein McsA
MDTFDAITGEVVFIPPEFQYIHFPSEYITDSSDDSTASSTISYSDTCVTDTDIGETADIQCHGCSKHFTTMNSWKRHNTRSPVCQQWIEIQNKKRLNYSDFECIVDFIDKIKVKVTSRDETDNIHVCKYCNTSFSNMGNLNKHYKIAGMCNNMALYSFIEYMKTL